MTQTHKKTVTKKVTKKRKARKVPTRNVNADALFEDENENYLEYEGFSSPSSLTREQIKYLV